MYKPGILLMIGLLISLGNMSLAYGQGDGPVDGKSNGVPVAGTTNSQAVAELERAQELFRADDREKEALAVALPLVEVFRSANDFDHLVDTVFLIGDCYYYDGDWANAERYMREAADLGYRYFPEQMSSYPLKVVGESQYEQGKLEESLATFRERVSKVRKSETDELAGALFDVAALMINTGEYQASLQVLGEALQENKAYSQRLADDPASSAADRIGASMDAAEIIYHAGVANFHMDKFEEAYGFIKEALAIFDTINGREGFNLNDRQVTLLDELVTICEKLGKTDEAEEYRMKRDNLNQ